MTTETLIGYAIMAVSGGGASFVAIRVGMARIETKVERTADDVAELKARDDKHADGMGAVREKIADHEARIYALERSGGKR